MDVSFQLYSARNFPPRSDVVALLARCGYTQTEGFFGIYDNPREFRALLDQHGLTMPSGHLGLDILEDDFGKAVSLARIFDMKKIYCPYLMPADRPNDTEGWQALAGRLASIGKKVADEGIGFGWHNHDFEFKTLADGSLPMQILLDSAPDLEWEADIAWIARSGADPLDWITRATGRISAAHVKDIAPHGENLNEDGWADVGDGVMAWKTITGALRDAGVGLFVIEHDNPSDLERFARRSIAAFSAF